MRSPMFSTAQPLLAALTLAFCGIANTQDARPNIIVIMADDLGYSDIGCFGGEIDTPNLDRLAAGGVRLTNFYNTGRCCPSRASLLTGLYSHQAGIGRMVSSRTEARKPGPYQGYLNERCVTVAEVLREAGYATYMAGKWHVGERNEDWPRTRGFDRYFGLISGASSYYELLLERRQMALDDEAWTPPTEGFYMTDAFTDYAVKYIDEHESAAKPFFLYVPYTAPHWPLHAPEEVVEKYYGRYDEGWDALRAERYARMRELGVIDARFVLSERNDKVPAWESLSDKGDWARRMEVYAAMVDRMDQGIGKIIASLESRNMLDNTLIMFLADNGGCAESVEGRNLNQDASIIGHRESYVAYKRPWANASDTPFRFFKKWVHEGGIASPFIAHWPKGIEARGSLHPQVGHIIDIAATCIDLAGATYPARFEGNDIVPIEGRSLMPAFKNSDSNSDRMLYWEHLGNRAVRDGNWKLVAERRGAWELYNLADDPVELDDLSSKFPDRVERLASSYEQWAARCGVLPRD